MCFNVGQEIVVETTIAREYGKAAHLVGNYGNTRNDFLLFPNGKILSCAPEPNGIYDEANSTLTLHSLKFDLEPGFEQIAQDHRKLTLKGLPFFAFVRLYQQSKQEKEKGIFRIKLESFND